MLTGDPAGCYPGTVFGPFSDEVDQLCTTMLPSSVNITMNAWSQMTNPFAGPAMSLLESYGIQSVGLFPQINDDGPGGSYAVFESNGIAPAGWTGSRHGRRSSRTDGRAGAWPGPCLGLPLMMQPLQPSMVPEWYEDDRPTQRDALVSAATPAASSSPVRPLLTVLVGLNEGQVFALDDAETFIGRGRDAHVGVDDAGISRRHARIVRLAGPRYILEDLHSANGLFVNGVKIEHVEALVDGDRIQVGARLVLRFGHLSADEEALAHKLYEGSTRDALTGLYNRRYAGERLAAEVAHAQRHGTLFGLVLFDIDHFKRVNDTFGHQAGDGVLRVHFDDYFGEGICPIPGSHKWLIIRP